MTKYAKTETAKKWKLKITEEKQKIPTFHHGFVNCFSVTDFYALPSTKEGINQNTIKNSNADWDPLLPVNL